MEWISFIVEGEPVPWERPQGHGKRRYHSAEFKAKREAFLARCIQHRPEHPWDCAIMVQMCFYFERPKDHFTKKGLRPHAPKYKKTKPDASNLLKFVEDTLNGIFWTDDARIVEPRPVKVYGGRARTEVFMKKVE